MLILIIRTDQPEAELALYDGQTQLANHRWQAHRQLAATIHQEIKNLLERQHKQLSDLQGVVCFQGPGSFTGLRIGHSVGNALAYGLNIPIVAVGGDDWRKNGIARLQKGESDPQALPEYGAAANITPPKK